MATAEATINKSDARTAYEAIDGIIQIAKREQLKQGFYISQDIDQELKNEGAICGGRQACLIGSLYISYGIKGRWQSDSWGGKDWGLPGVNPRQRERYLKNKPDLKLAYETLNETALRYIKKNYPYNIDDQDETEPIEGWAEHLFESILPRSDEAWDDEQAVELYNATRDAVIQVCRNAKRKLKRDFEL